MAMCGCESCAQSITTFFIVTVPGARTIWKTYIQHSIDGGCCIWCVVIICNCCEKINATYCAFLPAALTAEFRCVSLKRHSFFILYLSIIHANAMCTLSKTEWEREKQTPPREGERKKTTTVISCGSIAPAYATPIYVTVAHDKQMDERKITRKLLCFGWIIWWNEIVKKKRITWNPKTNASSV